PMPAACAAVPLGDVLRRWQGLGYPRRARNLHEAATAMVAAHGGVVPDSLDVLLALPGIGPYTAGAVLTFAYGKPAPILDTNVRRVLRRIFFRDRAVADRVLWTLAGSLLPPGDGYNFNQALMDFGATVCTARAPGCGECPMRELCLAYPRLSRRAR
ncbi:MAG TPA: A/G-specific adenine glycosylase, partial [Gemmatimonadales bacterium]|nr:A/G-specific adenine glycosylase [Gemmatimonadales bacterium]